MPPAHAGPGRVFLGLVAGSLLAPALFVACSHDWDAYDPRKGAASPDAAAGTGGGTSTSTGSAGAGQGGGSPDAGDDAGEDADAGPTHVTDGLVALYTFEEGAGATVRDVSGVLPALDLTIADPAAVMWIPGGLSIVTSTQVSSSVPATKVFDACQATNEITLEVWFQPGLAEQGGPARLITSSADTSNRNFQLGQELASYYQARLRSTASVDMNGAPFLATPTDAGDVRLELTHLLFTRDAAGMRRLFVNGVERATDVLGGDFSNWDTTYHLALVNEFVTFNRTWLGDLHRAAIYSRALTPQEVTQSYQAGP